MSAKYSCPHCGQHVAIDNAPSGISIKCPNCGTSFALAQPVRRSLLRSPVYWGMVIAVAIAIPVTMVLMDRSKRGATKPVVAKSGATLPIGQGNGRVFEGRQLVELVDEMDIQKGKTPEAKATRELLKRAGESIIPDLINLFNDSNTPARRRGNAIQAMGFTGAKTDGEVELLWNAMKETNPYLRYSAVYSLQRLEVDPHRLVPRFMEMLDDPDSMVRRSAADSLGNIGDVAEPAIPKLEALLNDDVPTTRDKAAQAIKKITAAKPVTENEQLNAAFRALSSTEFQTRYEARVTIGKMGQAIVPDLIRILADKNLDPQHRWHAAEGLGYAGAAGGAEIPLLIESLKDPNRLVRANALEALWRIKIDLNELVPICIRMLGDPDKEVRRRAAVGLGNQGPDAAEGLPALQKAIGDENEAVRGAVVTAIKKISGPGASGTRPGQ